MQWNKGDESPAISGQYLVYIASSGIHMIADYSSMKKKWTVGQGWESERVFPDYWAKLTEPEVDNNGQH